IRTKWLFGYGGHIDFGDTDTPYEEREKMIKDAQLAAVREIFDCKGLRGLFELAAMASVPHLAGVRTAEAGVVSNWQDVLPNKLLPAGGTDSIFTLGYVGRRISLESNSFVESLPLEDW